MYLNSFDFFKYSYFCHQQWSRRILSSTPDAVIYLKQRTGPCVHQLNAAQTVASPC